MRLMRIDICEKAHLYINIRMCVSCNTYRSAINLCEYKIMRVGQFWRFKNFMRFLNGAIVLSERFF